MIQLFTEISGLNKVFSVQNMSVKLFVVGFERNPDYKVVGSCRFHCITIIISCIFPKIQCLWMQLSCFDKQVIRVKKKRGAAAPRTRITCKLFGKPKNAVCI